MAINKHDMHFRPLNLRDLNEPDPAILRAAAFQAATMVAEPAVPAAPTFSEAELLKAKQEAEALGYKKGLAKARADSAQETLMRETQLGAALDGLMARLDSELAALQAHRVKQQPEMTRLVLMIAGKLTGNLLQTHPIAPIEPMLAECITMLSAEDVVSVRVAEQLVPLLEKHLRMRPRGMQLTIIGDAAMQVGDCKIEWAGGVAGRNQQDLWIDITRIVERALVPFPEENKHGPQENKHE